MMTVGVLEKKNFVCADESTTAPILSLKCLESILIEKICGNLWNAL